MKYNELGEDIKQEYPSTPDEAFMGSSEGFWYLKELNQCREAGRITSVPFQPQCLVHTAWDLGFGDCTSVWFYQQLPSGSLHIIDYYENSGEGLSHYISYIRTLPYKEKMGSYHMPHDAGSHEMGSGLSVAQQAKDLGVDVNILNRYNPSKSSMVMEIQRARNLIARCYFDESNTAQGLKRLENYRKKWNESMCCYTSEPVHDWASHGSDAFRYLAQAVETGARKPDDSKMQEERRKIRNARRMRI